MISRRFLIDDAQWSETIPSEALGGNPGTHTGEHGASMPARGPPVCWQGVGRTGHAQLGKYALCFSPTCSGCGPRAGEASLPPSCCLFQTHLGSRPQTHTGLSKTQHPPQSWNVPAGPRQKSLKGKVAIWCQKEAPGMNAASARAGPHHQRAGLEAPPGVGVHVSIRVLTPVSTIAISLHQASAAFPQLQEPGCEHYSFFTY